jgi:chorismate mutase/prephenate dehydratase
MAVSAEVGKYKIESGKKVFDKARENEKLASVSALASSDFNKHGIQELYEQIMSMSRKLQYQLLTQKGALGKLPFIGIDKLDFKLSRVVFQGVKGAYSEAAMKKYFGEDINGFAVATFRDAMEAIEEGAADFAVLPIENSSAGAVSDVYDLLVEFENYIVAEEILEINHCLAGVEGATLKDITHVYSHPQALMQSSRFLDQHGDWEQISVGNTAMAAQMVLDSKDITKAAVCSEYAAQVYGLQILEHQINHNSENSTRFIIVTNQKVFLKEAQKISLCFELPHESGSLYRLLSHFIYNDLNLCKIESRPLLGRSWEYRFFVDVEGNMADPAVKNAIRGLREEARNLRILGNY